MAADGGIGNWMPSNGGNGVAQRLIGSMPAMAQLGDLPDFRRLSILPDGNGAVPFCYSYNIPAASVIVTKDQSFAWDLFANIVAPTALTNQFGYSGDTSNVTFLITDMSCVINETTNITTGTYTPTQIELLLGSYWITFGQGLNTRYISLQQCGRVGSVDVAAISTTNATEMAIAHMRCGMFSDGGVWHADGTGVPIRLNNDRGNAQLLCGNTHGITIIAGSTWKLWVKGYAFNATIDLQSPGGSRDACNPAAIQEIPGVVDGLLKRFNVRRLAQRLRG